MMHVLKLVPAVSIALFLASNIASAEDFGKLPKYGPVPEMRPIRLTETTAPSTWLAGAVASCSLECWKTTPTSRQD